MNPVRIMDNTIISIRNIIMPAQSRKDSNGINPEKIANLPSEKVKVILAK